MTNLRLSPLDTGRSPDATVTPNAGIDMAAGGSRSFDLSISSWAAATPPTALSLLASYRSGGVAHVTGASVELSPPTPLDIGKLASVEVKASLATLRSGETEPVYLLVTDKASQSLTIRAVKASHPDFIDFGDLPQNVTVAPGETTVLTLNATADPQVTPGEQQLVFRLPATIGGTNFDLVASQMAKVGVTGEAELLTVLGVPSLLLLPGFLVIATASLLWKFRLGRKEWDGDAFPLQLKEPEFWVVAVVASIVIVLLGTKVGIDLLGRYGLEDLVKVWVASMLIGVAIYLPVVVHRNRSRASRVPTDRDDPCGVLRKLAKQGLNLQRQKVAYDTGGATAQLYLLQPQSEKRPSTWACPRIVYSWDQFNDALNERIQEQLDQSHDAGALAESFTDGAQRKLLTVEFAGKPGGITSPTLLPKEKVTAATSEVMVGEKPQ